MSSRLFHQKIEEIADDHTEEFLDGPGDESGAELKEKEVDKPIQ
jgi:hypothetical protein